MITDLVRELRERKVFRTAAIYLVVAWGTVEVSTTLLPLLGIGDWAARLVLAILAAGFPVTVGLAWVFDIGDRRARGSEEVRGVRLGQAALVAGAVLVGLALPTFLLLDSRAGTQASVETPPDAAASAQPAVAVVPFRAIEGDADDDWFPHGMTDAMALALSRFDGLRVFSPDAAEALATAGLAAREIAERLGADYVLSGSVRRARETVRVLASLRDAASDEIVWSGEFDRELSVQSLFELESEVASAVASQLEATLAPDRAARMGVAPTRDLDAFDHYLRGNYELDRRTPASVARAVAEYRAAREIDPTFSAALAREAYAYALFVDWEWSFPGADAENLMERARSLVGAAMADDSTSADVWLARAYVDLVSRRDDPAEALPAFERALELNPSSAEAYHQYGQSLMLLGRLSEAAVAYHAALALDPTRAMTLVPLSGIAARNRDRAGAERWSDSAIAVGPDVPYAWAVRANVRLGEGDPEAAAADARHAIEIDPSYSIPARSALAAALWAKGDSAGAHRELELALASLPSGTAPGQTDAFFLGGALISLGQIDRALALVEAARPRSAWLWFYLQHPDFDPLREDPRFQAVLSEADPRR